MGVYPVFARVVGFVFALPSPGVAGIAIIVLLGVTGKAGQIHAIADIPIGPMFSMKKVVITICLVAIHTLRQAFYLISGGVFSIAGSFPMEIFRMAIKTGITVLIMHIGDISGYAFLIGIPVVTDSGTMTGGAHIFFAGCFNELMTIAYPLFQEAPAGSIGSTHMTLSTGGVTTGTILRKSILDICRTVFE